MKRFLAAPALCVLGCLTGCSMFVSKGDYADYRTVRLAVDEPARLLAMQHYVASHPAGYWHDQLQNARMQHDVATFEAGKSSRAGLEHYVAEFPDGTFAAQARSRLAALDLVDQRKREEAARATMLAVDRAKRQDELRRTWVTRFIDYWAHTLFGLSAWGEPIPDVARDNPTFSRAFGAEPRPRCTLDECVKYYAGNFAVPVPGGTRVERTLSLVLRLRMRAGKLERAELLLPDRGFSRLYELENKRLVVDTDPEGRKAAVAFALERLEPALQKLGQGITLDPTYTLAAIEAPALGPNGEATDTAAEDPSVPPNRLAEDSPRQRSIEELVAPKNEPTPDMVFDALQVDKQGHGHVLSQPSAAAAAPPVAGGGDVMVMAPMAVPTSKSESEPGSGAVPAPAAPAPATEQPVAPAPAITRAYRGNGLRVVLFAAAQDAANAYDGVLIERDTPQTPPAHAPHAARATSPTRH